MSSRFAAGLLPAGWFDIRAGERRLAALFFLYFFLLEAAHYASKSVRQATYIDTLGAERLPWVYLAVALLSFPVLVGYTRLVQRIRHGVMVIASGVGLAISLVVFWALFVVDAPGTAAVFYVFTTIAFGVAVSQFWLWAAHAFDARQARRLFALIGAGGLLGGIPGGQIATWIARFAGTRDILVAAALLLMCVVAVAVAISRRLRGRGGDGPSPPMTSVDEARGGLEVVLSSRLLILTTALMVLTVVLAQMVDLQFYWAVERHTTGLDQRASVVGLFFSLMGLFAFAFQVLFTQRIHRAAGVGAGLRVLPLVIVVGGSLVTVSMAFLPALVYATVWMLKLGETAMRHSVDQASRELLFVPVAPDIRRRAKAYIDVFVQRASKGLAALLLLPVTFGWLGQLHLAVATVIGGVVWIATTLAVRVHYLRAFRQGLKSDIAEPELRLDSNDATTVVTLVEAVAGADPNRAVHGLELLTAAGMQRLVSPLMLHHEDPRVRALTLGILATAGRTDALPRVRDAAADTVDEVRAAALRTLAQLDGEGAEEVLSSGLLDPAARVRGAAAAGLLAVAGSAASSAEDTLSEMASDGDPRVRREAARAFGEVPEPKAATTLVQLLYDDDLEVVRETIDSIRDRALRDGGNPLFAPSLVAMTANRRVSHEAREALVAFGEAAVPALVHFMNSEDEQLPVRRSVPRILARTGTAAAGHALAEALETVDLDLRAEVIEALASIHRRHDLAPPLIRRVRAAIEHDVRRYLRDLADLWSVSRLHQARLDGPWAVWPRGGQVPSLLQQVLASRMAISVRNIFRLLELVLEPEDIRAARRSLSSRTPGMRARALEFLDNTLMGSLRRDVACVIDDAPAEDKLRNADHLFGISCDEPGETLRRLVGAADADREGSPVLTSAAIYTVVTDRMVGMHELVRRQGERADSELVRETAMWAMARLDDRQGRDTMADMARIEKMAFLQGIDVFAECEAEEVLRTATIADERRVPAGEMIFQRDDPPDAMYCVVDGRIRLEVDGQEPSVIGSGGRFGVIDILSGRPRNRDAIADAPSHLLVIEAEDFFDVLAGNVGIVRALFRQVLRDHGSRDP